jgi:hypothetical protein
MPTIKMQRTCCERSRNLAANETSEHNECSQCLPILSESAFSRSLTYELFRTSSELMDFLCLTAFVIA